MEGWRQGPAGAMGVAGMGTAGEGAGEWLRLQGGTQNHSQAQGTHPLVTPLTLSATPLPICAISRDVLKPHGAGWVEGCPDSGLQHPAQLFSVISVLSVGLSGTRLSFLLSKESLLNSLLPRGLYSWCY